MSLGRNCRSIAASKAPPSPTTSNASQDSTSLRRPWSCTGPCWPTSSRAASSESWSRKRLRRRPRHSHTTLPTPSRCQWCQLLGKVTHYSFDVFNSLYGIFEQMDRRGACAISKEDFLFAKENMARAKDFQRVAMNTNISKHFYEKEYDLTLYRFLVLSCPGASGADLAHMARWSVAQLRGEAAITPHAGVRAPTADSAAGGGRSGGSPVRDSPALGNRRSGDVLSGDWGAGPRRVNVGLRKVDLVEQTSSSPVTGYARGGHASPSRNIASANPSRSAGAAYPGNPVSVQQGVSPPPPARRGVVKAAVPSFGRPSENSEGQPMRASVW